MKIFGREPTLYVTIIGAVLAWLVTLQIDGLTEAQAAAIMGALTALVGAVNGLMVRPFKPAFANGLVAAVVGVLVAYGVDAPWMTSEAVISLQAVLVAIGGLWAVRQQVTPKIDPVPTAPSEGVVK